MAAPDPDSREFRQMRHDVDDVYGLLEGVDNSITTISATQRRHGNRLEEIQQSLDLQSGRLNRMEDTQRQQAGRLGRVETRLGGIEETQQEQGERLGRVEGRLDEILTLLRGRSG
jgi:chromosome segregation ATPase